MFKFPLRQGPSEVGLQLDLQRRRFLNRLIECDILDDVMRVDDRESEALEGQPDKAQGLIERMRLEDHVIGLHVDQASLDNGSSADQIEDIAGGWRAFDMNRSMLTLARRVAADYARKSRQFATLARLATVLVVGTAIFVAWHFLTAADASVSPAHDHSVSVAGRPAMRSIAATVTTSAAESSQVPHRSVASVRPAAFVIHLAGDANVMASFPFEMRADDTLGVTSFVLIRGVPPGAIVSNAQPLSPSVWVMPASALASSTLSVSSLAPPTFQLHLDAMNAAGIRYASFLIDVLRHPTDTRVASD